jgi:hypothetical protein
LKGLVSGGKESDHTKSNIHIEVKASTDEDGLRENKTLRAVREREERVKAGREILNTEIERSKMGINMEEGERKFLWVWATIFVNSTTALTIVFFFTLIA